MSYKKFESSDIIFNTIKANPRYEFKIYKNEVTLNNGPGYLMLSDFNLPVTAVECQDPYSFDFSCKINSYNIVIL